VKSGGRLILVVPCSWPYHEAPYDCWRIYPEGIRALVEEVGLIPEILTFGSLEQPEFSEAIPGRSFDHQPEEYRDIVLKLAVTNNFPVEKSFDSICVARKPEAFGFEFDHLSKAAYDAALEEHARKIAPVLRRLDAALEQGASGNGDPRELAHWRTMRTLLISGLFDAEFYLERYPDIREARVDPLQHYVIHGEAEYRQPNRFFYPRYYRRLYMSGVPAEYNALQHYTEVGERSGARPNYAFDPQEYLAAYGSLGNYVDRPFFHFLKVGQERAQAAFGSVPESALIRHSPDSAD
jgi:hypothetical protein